MTIRRSTENFVSAYGVATETAALSAPSNQQLLLYSASAHNRSGGAADTGLLVKHSINDENFKVGFLDDSATPDYVDLTSDLQAGTASTIFSTTDDDGFLVQFDRKIGLIGFNVSTAEDGSPVYAYSYYNGTSYATLTTISVPDYSGTGTELIVFLPPIDWAVGTTAAVGGETDLYSIRVIATTSATAASVQIDDIWIASWLDFQDALADNGNLEITFPDERPLTLEAGEALVPYFGTVAAGNMVAGSYSVLP